MNADDILNLKVSKGVTIRSYLKSLLVTLWDDPESFSGKRPFGNSGWQYDLYLPLIKANVVSGRVSSDEEDECVEECDSWECDKVILNCINHIFSAN